MNSVKISVVTVVYNDHLHIEQTMLSVLNQTYDNIEYVVIDGGSTDGTVDIIKKYADKLAYWVSKPDNGIYDAMNKGIDFISGDYVNFMNSGDSFFSNDTVSSLISSLGMRKADVLYGDVMMKYSSREDVLRHFHDIPADRISTNLCHQSTFTNVELMKKYKYDPSFRIAADMNFFTTIYRQERASFLYIPITIANYEAEEGVSAKNLRRMYDEYMKIYGYKKFSLSWWYLYLKLQLKLLYYNLPSSLFDKLHKRRLAKLYNSK